MYDVYFYKMRDLTIEDLPFVKSMANLLQIDFSIYDVTEKEGKLFLSLKKEEKLKNIKNQKFMKNMWRQKTLFCYVFLTIGRELFYQVCEREEEQKKLTKKK